MSPKYCKTACEHLFAFLPLPTLAEGRKGEEGRGPKVRGRKARGGRGRIKGKGGREGTGDWK